MHPEHSRWHGPVHPPPDRRCAQCGTVPVAGKCKCWPLKVPLMPDPEPPRRVYVTNFAARRTPGFMGPAHRRRFTMMRSPGAWGWGDGDAKLFIPSEALWQELRNEEVEMPEYLERFRKEVWSSSYDGRLLLPGMLKAYVGRRPKANQLEERGTTPVKHGDTICCSCSRTDAYNGNCHRVPVAYCLLAHGWDVVLDGIRLLDLKPSEG